MKSIFKEPHPGKAKATGQAVSSLNSPKDLPETLPGVSVKHVPNADERNGRK